MLAFVRSSPLTRDASLYSSPAAFGTFRVLHQIGAGTLGPVYRALDAEHDRLIAIKAFQLELTPEKARQLADELQRLVERKLTHPSIVAMLATGVEGGGPFQAQEYFGGEPLDQALRDYGPAPIPDGLLLLTRLAGALDFAAVTGVYHGALHPHDVLVTTDDTRLTGLGVAQALEAIGARPPVRHPYAAPERADEATRCDRATDVFALGVIAHEIFFGRPLAATGDRMLRSLGEIPGVDSTRLAAVFSKALAPNPSDRQATALTFVAELEQVLTTAAAPSAIETPALEKGFHEAPPDGEKPELPLSVLHLKDESEGPTNPAGQSELELPHPIDRLHSEVLPAIAPEQNTAQNNDDAADPMLRPGARDPEVTISRALDPVPQTAAPIPPHEQERSRPSRRIAIAVLLIGLLAGFAGGYALKSVKARATAEAVTPRGNVAPAAAAAKPSGREYTEDAIPDTLAATEPPGEIAQRTAPSPVPSPAVSRPSTPALVAGQRGRLLIRSSPSGANVTIDGSARGVTPLAVRNLSIGRHTIRLTQAGYQPKQERVTLSGRRPAASLDLRLRSETPSRSAEQNADFYGSLSVDSRPSGARVFLNGKAVGVTPVVLDRVPAGSQVLRIDRDGYDRWSSTVRIVAGERNRVTASLDRGTRP